MKNRINFLKKIAVLLLGIGIANTAFAQQKPNIVLILVDDLGFSDIEPYGGIDIKTPHISKLASEGTIFKEFYNNSICAPTRASLLTGQYPHKAGVGYFNVNLGLPAYQGFLNKESLTLAEVLKSGGYSTIISGKWHVGDDKDQWPAQRGFEKSFGFIGGASNYYEINDSANADVKLIKNNQPYYLEKDKYLTDAITDNALGFLDEQSKEKKPFFLYLAFNAPHWPLQALPQDIEQYKGIYSSGWDSFRVQRYRQAVLKGVFDKDQAIARHDEAVQPWNKLTYDEQQYWQYRQQVYAAMIDHVDQSIGRLLNKLKELKKDENTLIILLSDNGAQGGNGLRLYTQRNTGPVGSAGSYEVQNSNWSQTGNSPLRNYKGTPYEGGISAPFIAWLPKFVPAATIVKGSGHLIDIAPTLYELAGIKYPAIYNGIHTNRLPGKSLLPVLYGKSDTINRQGGIFWERGGNIAVRHGKWKLVQPATTPGKYELYDITKDRAENTDLAKENPEIVAHLQKLYKEWAAENDVVDYSLLRPQSPAGR